MASLTTSPVRSQEGNELSQAGIKVLHTLWIALSAACSNHTPGVHSGAEASVECCDGHTSCPPKNFHVLIAETFESLTLHGKRDPVIMMKLRNFR